MYKWEVATFYSNFVILKIFKESNSMKKFISIMLAVIMIFGLFPFGTLAQTEEALEKITASATNEGVETVETEDTSALTKATTTVSGNTYQRVSKIDSTTANYLIVYEGGTTKKAFTGYGTDNIQAAASNAVDVNITSLGKDSGGNGIYRITKTDGSALATNSKWRFSKKAETALTAYPMYVTNASNGYFIQGASTRVTTLDDNRIYNENPASYTANGGSGKSFDVLYLNQYPIAPEAGSTKLWTGTNMYAYAPTTSSKIKPRGGLTSGLKFLAGEVAQSAQSIKSFYSANASTNGNTSMPKVVPINHGGATYLITLFDWFYMACQILKAASGVTPMTAVTYRPTTKPETAEVTTARDYNSHTTARLTQIATDTLDFVSDAYAADKEYRLPGYDYRYGETPCYVTILGMANWLDSWHDSKYTNSDGTKGGNFVTKPSSASINYNITYKNTHTDGTSYTSGDSTPPYLYFDFGGRDIANHLAIKDNDGNSYGYAYSDYYGGWTSNGNVYRNDPTSTATDTTPVAGTRGYKGTEATLYGWTYTKAADPANPVVSTAQNVIGINGSSGIGTYQVKSGDVLEVRLKLNKALTAKTLIGVKFDKETAYTYPSSQSKAFAAGTYYTFTFNTTTQMVGKKITQIRLDPIDVSADVQFVYDYVYIGPKKYAPSYTNPDSVTSGAKSDFIKTPADGTEYENCMIVIPAASSADASIGTNRKFDDANMESDRFVFAWYNNNNSIYYNTSYLRYTDGRYSDRFVFSPSHYKYTQLLSHSANGTASRVGSSHAFQPDPLNASGGYLTLNDANTSDANASALPDEFSSFVHYMAPAYMTIYKEISSATVTTPDTPEVVEEPKLEKDNPLYPAAGSTQINKSTKGVEWESTGIGEVELSVKGVGYRKYTDFVVVMDLSKSLWDNGKANASQSAVNSFIDTILKTTLAPSNNRIALVTFGNYATKAQDFTNDPQALKNAVAAQITTASALTRNDTNYDDAFRKANEYLNSRTDKSREGVILFLTDGAPSFYNDNHAWNYWGVSSASDTFASSSLVSIDKTNALAATGARVDDKKRYSTTTNLWASGTTGFDFFEDAFMYSTTSEAGTGSTTVSIDGGENAMYQRFVLNTSHIYSDIAKKNGYEVYAIGLELDNGSSVTTKVAANTATRTTSLPYVFFDASETKKIVKGVASDASHYIETTVANVQSQFETIADNYTVGAGFYQDPATEAVVTDKISVDYDLQYLTKGTVIPAITVKQYPTITYEMIGTIVNGETVTLAHVGNRITSEEPTILETVTFSGEGEATSSQLEGNVWTGNAVIGEIVAKYFTYDFATETFTWNVGTVIEDELTLTYNVYLSGSKEGTRPRGIYNVAEDAELTYTNIDNNEVTKDFPEANLAWGGAVTTYEYYLVNEDGIPVNLLGERVGTDDRTVVYGPISKDVNLNASSGGQAITATLNIPKGYTLYNPDASYTVTTSSDGSNGDITINDTGDTTIIINGDFNESHIAFAVKYNDGAVDDYTILDWDKKVQIDVTKNDVTMENPKLVAIALNEEGSDATSTNGVAINGRTSTLPVTTTAVDGVFGNASIVDGKVEYVLDSMLTAIEHLFCWIQEGNSALYSPSKLRIIPATNIYYEDSFSTDSEEENATRIYFNGNWTVVGIEDDEYQDSENKAYGYDSSYNDDTTDSNGSSKVLTSTSTDRTKAVMSFVFNGTGFDLISRTASDTGSILYRVVNVTTGKIVSQSVVNTLYKYDTMYQIPVIAWEAPEYGTYKVEVFAFGTQAVPQKVYVDGIRIYNPLGTEESRNEEYDDARDAYNTQHELNSVLFEVRPLLFTGTTDEELDSAIFIDGSLVGDENNTTDKSDAYKFGPNNELYLNKNQTLAFNVTTLEVPSSIQIGAKSPFGEAVQFTVTSTGVVPITQNVTSATNMYYNITSGLQVVENADGTYTASVIITNVSEEDAILALTDIKVVAGNVTTAAVSADQQLIDAAIEYTDKVRNEENVGDEIIIIGGIEYENGKTIKSTSVFDIETISASIFGSAAAWYFSYLR